jgi:hypothetical protein
VILNVSVKSKWPCAGSVSRIEVEIEGAVRGQSDRTGLARRGVERRHRRLVLAVAHRQIEVLPHRVGEAREIFGPSGATKL